MKLKIHTDGYEGFKKRSLERAAKIDRGEKIAASKSITFESPLDIFEVLTAERIRLCMLARTKPHSISGLATALKRDPKSVRRDVIKLEKYGVLTTREETNPGHGRVRIVVPAARSVVLQTTF